MKSQSHASASDSEKHPFKKRVPQASIVPSDNVLFSCISGWSSPLPKIPKFQMPDGPLVTVPVWLWSFNEPSATTFVTFLAVVFSGARDGSAPSFTAFSKASPLKAALTVNHNKESREQEC